MLVPAAAVFVILINGSGAAAFEWAAWVLCCYSLFYSAWAAASSLAEDREDGCWELLASTRVNAWDLLSGKFVGSLAGAFYTLIGAVPVLTWPMLTGGIAMDVFARVIASLLLATVLGGAVGMASAARGGSEFRVLATAFSVCVALAGGPYAMRVLDVLPDAWAWLEGASPLNLLRSAMVSWMSPARLEEYSASFLLIAAIVVSFGSVAWLYLRRALDLRASAGASVTVDTPGEGVVRPRPNAGNEPVGWLVERQIGRSLRVAGWVALTCAPVPGLLFLLHPGGVIYGERLAVAAASLVTFGLMFVMCRAASQPFVEARRNGSIEVLLTTPLSGTDRAVDSTPLLADQWRALRRLFRFPTSAGLCVIGITVVIVRWRIAGMPFANGVLSGEWILGGIAMMVFYLDGQAAIWLGMWEGISSKGARWAAIRTFALLIVVPTVAVFATAQFRGQTDLVPYLLTRDSFIVMLLIKSTSFASHARGKLELEFRNRASGTIERDRRDPDEIPLPPFDPFTIRKPVR